MPTADPPATTSHRQVLDGLRHHVEQVLGDVLERGRPVALVNFPNHRNVGDAAIWLGAERALAAIGVPVRYRAAWDACSVRVLRQRIGDGPVVVNGGGNFGDLYRGQQGLRERLLAACRSNPIVQLPQSIHFADVHEAERVARLVAGHGDVTLLCREQQSTALAEELFDCSVRFCPDMAFALGPLERPAPARADIVWLARADGEARHPPPPEARRSIAVLDWLEPLPGEAPWPDGARWPYQLNAAVLARMRRGEPSTGRWWRPAAATFAPLAEAWLRRGLRLLADARVVVTDRLHAHVMASAMGIPSVVLDNSYGKVHGVVEASTAGSPLTHRAENAEEAWATATALVEDLPHCPEARS